MLYSIHRLLLRSAVALVTVLAGFAAPSHATHPGGYATTADARIQAIHRGEAGRYGDLIRVTIKGGTVRFRRGRHRRYFPVSFNIANGETKTIAFRSAQRRSYVRGMRVSYRNGAFILEDGTRGAVGYRYSQRWSFGRAYQPVYLSHFTNTQGRALQVSVRIVRHRRAYVPTDRPHQHRFGDLIQVNVSGGVMRFRRHSHRRGYYPVTFTIAAGESKIVEFRSAQRRSYRRPVRVAYRNGSFIFEDGTSGARYFHFTPRWRLGKGYGPVNFSSRTHSEGRGIKFAISLVRPRGGWTRDDGHRYRDYERHHHGKGRYHYGQRKHAVMVVVKNGTMVIDRYRQYYQPVRTMLRDGDRKLVKVVSANNPYEYIYVPIAYRRGKVRFDGDFFVRDFPHHYRRNRAVVYRDVNMGPGSRSRGRGLTIKVVKQ